MAKRILSIDDESDVLEIIRAVLRTKGHQVVTALGGEAGLIEAERVTPDLITLDLMMPRMSGLEVIKRLKASDKLRHVPVIVISAIAADDKRTAEFWIKGLGVADFIDKPFDPLDLLGRVEYLFRRSTYGSAPAPSPAMPAGESAGHAAPASRDGIPKDAVPSEVVRRFVESWNERDFGTEFDGLGEEMTGGLQRADYVARRLQVYQDDNGHELVQRVAGVVSEDVSVNLAKVVIDREEVHGGRTRRRREAFALKKTLQGWRIVNYRALKESPAAE